MCHPRAMCGPSTWPSDHRHHIPEIDVQVGLPPEATHPLHEPPRMRDGSLLQDHAEAYPLAAVIDMNWAKAGPNEQALQGPRGKEEMVGGILEEAPPAARHSPNQGGEIAGRDDEHALRIHQLPNPDQCLVGPRQMFDGVPEGHHICGEESRWRVLDRSA